MQLRRRLLAASSRARVLVVRGMSGMGHSTLLDAGAQQATTDSLHVVRLHGRRGGGMMPLSAFEDGIANLPAAASERATHVLAYLRSLRGDKPVAILVDDARWCDESSLGLLLSLASMDDCARIRVVLTDHLDADYTPACWTSVTDVAAQDVVELTPLPTAAMDAILDPLATQLRPTQLLRVLDLACGNPGAALELAEAAVAGLEIPDSWTRAVQATLRSIEPVQAELLELLALAHGSLPNAVLRCVLEADLEADFDALHQRGLICTESDFTDLRRPADRIAIRALIPAARRRMLHRELADACQSSIADPVDMARLAAPHLTAIGHADRAADILDAAAQCSAERGLFHEVVADALRAAELADAPERRLNLLVRAGEAAVECSSQLAASTWQDVTRLASRMGNDEMQAYALLQQYYTTADGAAFDRLERAAALDPQTIGWSATAAADIAQKEDRASDAIALDISALEIARRTGDQQLELWASRKLSIALTYTGDQDGSIAMFHSTIDAARKLGRHVQQVKAVGSLTYVLLEQMRLTEALDVCTAARNEFGDHPDLLTIIDAHEALLRVESGEISRAWTLAQRACSHVGVVPGHQGSAIVHSLAGEVALQRGIPFEIAPLVATAASLAASYGYQSLIFEADFLKLRQAALEGHWAQAVEIAQSLEIAESGSMFRLALWCARTSVVRNQPDLLAVATHIAATAIPECELAQAACAEIGLIVTIGADQPELLLERAAHWHDRGFVTEAARAKSVAAVLMMPQSEQAATTLLHEAHRELVDAGATAEANHCALLLRQAGQHPCKVAQGDTIGVLSRRESTVAQHIAQGLRNQDIAQLLGLSERTIESYVSSALRKTDCSSRLELAGYVTSMMEAVT